MHIHIRARFRGVPLGLVLVTGWQYSILTANGGHWHSLGREGNNHGCGGLVVHAAFLDGHGLPLVVMPVRGPAKAICRKESSIWGEREGERELRGISAIIPRPPTWTSIYWQGSRDLMKLALPCSWIGSKPWSNPHYPQHS